MAASIEDPGERALIRRVREFAVGILNEQLRMDEERRAVSQRNETIASVALVAVPLAVILKGG